MLTFSPIRVNVQKMRADVETEDVFPNNGHVTARTTVETSVTNRPTCAQVGLLVANQYILAGQRAQHGFGF